MIDDSTELLYNKRTFKKHKLVVRITRRPGWWTTAAF